MFPYIINPYNNSKYFSEINIFLSSQKNKNNPNCLCDNCNSTENTLQQKCILTDMSKETRLIVDLLGSLDNDYGATKLILTLTGSTSKSLSTELRNNTYYGKGKYHTGSWWKEFFILLTDKKYLSYKLYANKYKLVILGNKHRVYPIMLELSEDMQLLAVDQGYLLRLKNVRTDIANKEKVAPYMVLSDTVLLNIAQIRPKSIDMLLNVNGITKLFAQKHGNCFINMKVSTSRYIPPKKTGSSSNESLKLYKSGKSFDEIAKCRGIKTFTVENHISYEFSNDLSLIDREKIGLTPQIYKEISEAVKKAGRSKLKPIKELVGKHISYFHIKVALLLM